MTDKFLSRRNLFGAVAAVATPVVLNGIPALAWAQPSAPTPPPLAVYGKLPTISKVALSPDGTRVCLAMNKDGGIVMYDYDLTTGKTAAAAIDGDKIRDLMWADNKSIFVTTSKTSKFGADQIEEWLGFIIDVHAGRRYQLYSEQKDFRAVIFGDIRRIKVNGGYRITASNFSASGYGITTEINTALYGFTTEGHRGFLIDEDGRRINNWVIRYDGTLVARSEYDDDKHVWSLRYRTEKGWRNIYEVKAELDMPYLSGLGRDGQSVLLYMNDGDLKDKYVEVTPDGVFKTIDIDGATHWPIFHPTTFNLVGFGNTGGIAESVFYDPVFAQLPKLVKGAVGDIHADLAGFAEDPLHVLVFVQGEGNSGTYYAIDFRKGGYKEIGQSYPDLPMEWVADKAPYAYKAADGLEIPGFLTLPVDREAKNLALVVLPHGGPQSYDDSSFDFLSQALSSRGYAVLQPNYRGSAGYGSAFTASGYGQFGRKMQTDLSDGVRALVKAGKVDPKRVAIFGGSYGGYAALAGASIDPGVYNCAVSLAGISDIKAFMAHELEWQGYKGDSHTMRYWRRFLGDESRWDEISPVKHIDAIKVPILLIHGKDDTVVPFEQSTIMYKAMQKAGKSVELVELKQEDHWMSREPTRIQTVETAVAFLLKHNPPA
ncbi:alpha/beta hydrolase family protein [Asticcacaulis sp. AC466]|uniref:alpha/beta hydrolase family protein n=1 Tax=Asticcacaulis sp. AC466 TaxID=1282362 RepID=UPI00138ABAD1|nr:S9 family peptidase [Asticcacaulis sp. AC466]